MNIKWNAGLVASAALLCFGSTLMAEVGTDIKASKAEAKAAKAEAKAAKAPKAPETASVKLPVDFQEMVKALNLGEDIQLKLADIAKTRAATAKEFEEAHSAERTQLKAAAAAAKAAGNHDGVKESNTKLKELEAQEKAKVAPYEDAALALLTPEQQNDLRIYKIGREVLNSLRGVKLTEDQNAQLKTLIMAQLPALTAAGENEAQRRPILASLRDSVQKNILTADQLAGLQTKGDRSKMGVVAPAPATQPAK